MVMAQLYVCVGVCLGWATSLGCLGGAALCSGMAWGWLVWCLRGLAIEVDR